MKLSKTKLERTLNALARANTKAFEMRMLILDHSLTVYGKDPADIDNDEFIDACDSGCGTCQGMSADEFHNSMLTALNRGRR